MAPHRQDPIEFLTGRLSQSPWPSGVALPGRGGKFAPDGTVQIWPGNTFICHIDPESQAYRAIRRIQEDVKKSALARFFAFMPPSSFHMTVFQGLSAGMRGTDAWPDGIAEDAPRDTAAREIGDRIGGLDLPGAHRVRATDLYCAHSITVTGADAVQEASLRGMRQELRKATGIQPDGFDRYAFHITLGYLLEWVSDETAREIVDFGADVFDRLGGAIGEFALGPCEFCVFETMFHFEPLKVLG